MISTTYIVENIVEFRIRGNSQNFLSYFTSQNHKVFPNSIIARLHASLSYVLFYFGDARSLHNGIISSIFLYFLVHSLTRKKISKKLSLLRSLLTLVSWISIMSDDEKDLIVFFVLYFSVSKEYVWWIFETWTACTLSPTAAFNFRIN